MLVTQKCQYALRAMLVLARQAGNGPIKIAQIAEQQGIPYRFLEVILSQLKQAGFVESRRGTEGGYLLARPAAAITVADIVHFIDGPASAGDADRGADQFADQVFESLWREAADALDAVLKAVTIADLLARDETLRGEFIPNFQI
jgi:Rrf2 family protein